MSRVLDLAIIVAGWKSVICWKTLALTEVQITVMPSIICVSWILNRQYNLHVTSINSRLHYCRKKSFFFLVKSKDGQLDPLRPQIVKRGHAECEGQLYLPMLKSSQNSCIDA